MGTGRDEMNDHECDFPDTCPVCQGPVKKDDDPPQWKAIMVAQFDGHCSGCNLPISAGQIIAGNSEEGWRHRDCW